MVVIVIVAAAAVAAAKIQYNHYLPHTPCLFSLAWLISFMKLCTNLCGSEVFELRTTAYEYMTIPISHGNIKVSVITTSAPSAYWRLAGLFSLLCMVAYS